MVHHLPRAMALLGLLTLPGCGSLTAYSLFEDACGEGCTGGEPSTTTGGGPGTTTSTEPELVELCDNGADDDGDGNPDCADSDCADVCQENCVDGDDNDDDGDLDCEDPDCASTCDFDEDGALSELVGGDDCDDTDALVRPGADEVCDGGIDNDCSGLADDEDPNVDRTTMTTFWVDADQDGFGLAGATERACEQLLGLSSNDDDCDDASDLAFPGGVEVQCDGLDNDCVVGTKDVVDGDGDGSNVCNDCDDADAAREPGAAEQCDAVDNNCDLVVPVTEIDDDGDGDAECQGDPNDADATDEVVYVVGSEAQVLGGAGRVRGNIFLADTDNTIRFFSPVLDPAAACTIDYYLWEAPAPGGPWSTVWSGQVAHGAGYGPKDSPPIDIDVYAGTYYALAFGFLCNSAYYRAGNNSWLGVDGGLGLFDNALLFDAYTGYNPAFLAFGISAERYAYRMDVVMHR